MNPMQKINWKKVLPHLAAIAIFLLVALIYCSPILEGRVLPPSDVANWKGMVHQMQEYKAIHGHFPLWSNSMFGGMPGYQIAMDSRNPVSIGYFHLFFLLGLPAPISFFFLLCISFYFLTQVFRVNPWLGILGALAYAYCSFDAVLVRAGHETEILAMGYVPAVLASILLIYKGKYWLGAGLTGLFCALLLQQNHLQITYYLLIVALIMTIAFAIQWIKEKNYKHLVMSGLMTLLAGGIAVLANSTTTLTTYDYSKATMRGGALVLDSTASTGTAKSSGLPIDYAFQWSYGKLETYTLLVPDIYGGHSSGGTLDASSNVGQKIESLGASEDQAGNFAASMGTYWGDQPFTSGPVYIGAVICLLFIFGMFYLKSRDKWWIFIACLIGIILSWGKNFPEVNDFIFNHVPMYNKFRVPTMALFIPQLLMPLLAVLAVNQLVYGDQDRAAAWKSLKPALYVTGALALIAAGLYTSLSYTGGGDEQVKAMLQQVSRGNADMANGIFRALKDDRKAMFGADLMRALIYLVLAAGLLLAFVKNKIKPLVLVVGLLVLSTVDLLSVDRRYLNNDIFIEAPDSDAAFSPSQADQQINQDTSYYRVLNLATDPFADASTSYFHNSIGGYHPAKLSLVEDLLDYQLRFKQPNIAVLDMLNTKYIITRSNNPQNPQPVAQINPGACGPVWFVKSIQYVDGPAAAMKGLDNFNPKDTAIVENAFKGLIPFAPVSDSTASISLVKNDNDDITYTSQSTSNQFAVFSEIYYDRGWKAYIDGKEAPIVKTDYALRGLAVPSGKHDIKFEFRPSSYYTGEKLEVVGTSLTYILLIGGIFIAYRDEKKKKK